MMDQMYLDIYMLMN